MLCFDPDELAEPGDLAAFERIEALLGSFDDDDVASFDPPADLWDGIAGRLDDDRPGGAGASRLVIVGEPTGTTAPGTAAPSDLASARRRRAGARRWGVPLSAAAAVAVLAGVAATTLGSRGADPVELAAAPLGAVNGSGAAAEAELVREGDGRLHIVLDRASMPAAPTGFFYEIWLVDAAVTDPRSLSDGAMGERRDFTVPEGVDPARYPVIDVSLEPDDGNPSHAGTDHSVARGVLEL